MHHGDDPILGRSGMLAGLCDPARPRPSFVLLWCAHDAAVGRAGAIFGPINAGGVESNCPRKVETGGDDGGLSCAARDRVLHHHGVGRAEGGLAGRIFNRPTAGIKFASDGLVARASNQIARDGVSVPCMDPPWLDSAGVDLRSAGDDPFAGHHRLQR